MGNYHEKNSSGIQQFIANSEEVYMRGYTSDSLADAGVFTSAIDEDAGYLIVKDSTNNDTAQFLIVNTAGTVTTQLLGTQANYSATVDNVGTINVYIAGGVVTVQNNSGGAINLELRAYL